MGEDEWFQGEILTAAELTEMLVTWEAKVDEVKAQQRAEKEAAKAAKSKKHRRRRRGAEQEYDAFAEDAYRGCGDDDEEEEAEEAKEEVAASAAEAVDPFALTKHFYTKLAAPPEDIMKQAHEATAGDGDAA